jgi:hypothetical protein
VAAYGAVADVRGALAGVAVAALGLASLVVAAPATATGKVKCDVGFRNGADVTVAQAALDPIVYHNVDPTDPTVARRHVHGRHDRGHDVPAVH